MFKKSSPQAKLFDSTANVSDRKRAKIQGSWAVPFRETILPTLREIEDDFADFYHESNGRPNHAVSQMLGVLILKHEYDLTEKSTRRDWIRYISNHTWRIWVVFACFPGPLKCF